MLMQELVTLIEQRNAIVNCLDEDRQRCRGWGRGSSGLPVGGASLQPSRRSPGGGGGGGGRASESRRGGESLALPPVGHSASLSHFREEEEDKMLEAMIKRKGEATLYTHCCGRLPKTR